MGRDLAQLHLRHDRRPEGRRLPPSRRVSARASATSSPAAWASIRSICGRCRCSTATAGAFPGRSRSPPARMSACARCAPSRSSTRIAEHKVTHLCGAPIVMSTLLNAPADEKRALPHAGASSSPPRRRRPRPCSPAMKAAGFNVTHLYGLTEIYGPAVVNDWHAEWDALAAAEQRGARRRARACATRRSRRSTCIDPRDDAARARRRRDDGRGDVPRQRRDEGLPQEPGRDRRRPSPAAGSIPATSASSTRTATSSSRTARRTSSSPAARTFPRSRSRTRSTSTRPCRPRRWSPSPTRNGARRPAPSSS